MNYNCIKVIMNMQFYVILFPKLYFQIIQKYICKLPSNYKNLSECPKWEKEKKSIALLYILLLILK